MAFFFSGDVDTVEDGGFLLSLSLSLIPPPSSSTGSGRVDCSTARKRAGSLVSSNSSKQCRARVAAITFPLSSINFLAVLSK